MKQIDKIKLTIPFLPISVNEAFAWYPKRHKSNKYVEFENKMKAYFLQLWEKLEIEWEEWLAVQYRFYFPLYCKNWNKKIRDVQNFEKCLTDILWKNIIWFSDHKIKIITLSKFDSPTESTEIEILEIN